MARKTTKKAEPKRFATHLTTPQGRRVYISAKTKAELEEKVLLAKLDMRAGVEIGNDITFRQYAAAWLKAYKTPPIVKESTARSAKQVVECQINPFFGDMQLKDIKPMHVQMFITERANLSKGYARLVLTITRAIFRAAERDSIIPKSPCHGGEKAIGRATEVREPLTDDQMLDLLAELEDTQAGLFCLLALTTGLRRGELLALQWDAVDIKNKSITVRRNKPFAAGYNDDRIVENLKTDAAKRTIPLPAATLAEMKRQRMVGSPFVLSSPSGGSLTYVEFQKLWRSVKRAADRLGFHCHPHLLRHTYITKLFEQGLDLKQVQYLAGHSKPDMTLRVYTHYRRKEREAETAKQVLDAMSFIG